MLIELKRIPELRCCCEFEPVRARCARCMDPDGTLQDHARCTEPRTIVRHKRVAVRS